MLEDFGSTHCAAGPVILNKCFKTMHIQCTGVALIKLGRFSFADSFQVLLLCTVELNMSTKHACGWMYVIIPASNNTLIKLSLSTVHRLTKQPPHSQSISFYTKWVPPHM